MSFVKVMKTLKITYLDRICQNAYRIDSSYLEFSRHFPPPIVKEATMATEKDEIMSRLGPEDNIVAHRIFNESPEYVRTLLRDVVFSFITPAPLLCTFYFAGDRPT